MFPDHFVHVRGVGSRRTVERIVRDLRPGVTEIYVHPAVDTAELRALAPDWAARVDDHDLVVHDGGLRTAARTQRGPPHRLPPAPRAAAGRGSVSERNTRDTRALAAFA